MGRSMGWEWVGSGGWVLASLGSLLRQRIEEGRKCPSWPQETYIELADRGLAPGTSFPSFPLIEMQGSLHLGQLRPGFLI